MTAYYAEMVQCLQKHIHKLYQAQILTYKFSEDFADVVLDQENSFVLYQEEQSYIAQQIFKESLQVTSQFGALSDGLYRLDCQNVFAFPGKSDYIFKDVALGADIYQFKIDQADFGDDTANRELSHDVQKHDAFVTNDDDFNIVEQKLSDFIHDCDAGLIMPMHKTKDFNLEKILRAVIDNQHMLYFYVFKFSSLHIGGKSAGDGLLYLYAAEKLCSNELMEINNYFLRWSSCVSVKSLNQIRDRWSLRSAIGAIMSRNGSHNIGSHVLAALSHNVGTMPDDQVLYQYIQHRMDYIATATTDRPTWTQPTMFVGDMMRRFLSQRHLLNYISRSEGLKAWEFQSDKAARDGAGGHIKFHVRKVDKAGNVVPGGNYIDYDNPNNRIDLAGDVSLAIPGGIVGQHAFFTIIENIVRNAAKHDWVTPPTATQTLKFNGGDAKNPSGNLDIYIDFEDDPNDENVHFTIWTRLSDVMDGKTGKHKTKELNQSLYERCIEAEWAQWLSAKDIKNLPLHWHQEVELARPFIDENGGLRRENWGLAEMKISAGYLQKAKIEDIGGISKGGYEIIIPSCVTDERANDNAQTLEGVYHLGYKFDVPKAKLMLLVVDKWPKELVMS